MAAVDDELGSGRVSPLGAGVAIPIEGRSGLAQDGGGADVEKGKERGAGEDLAALLSHKRNSRALNPKLSTRWEPATRCRPPLCSQPHAVQTTEGRGEPTSH